MEGQNFNKNDEVIEAVNTLLQSQKAFFYEEGYKN